MERKNLSESEKLLEVMSEITGIQSKYMDDDQIEDFVQTQEPVENFFKTIGYKIQPDYLHGIKYYFIENQQMKEGLRRGNFGFIELPQYNLVYFTGGR